MVSILLLVWLPQVLRLHLRIYISWFSTPVTAVDGVVLVAVFDTVRLGTAGTTALLVIRDMNELYGVSYAQGIDVSVQSHATLKH